MHTIYKQEERIPHAFSIMLRIWLRRLSETLGSESSPGSLASTSIVSLLAPLLRSSAQVSCCPCRAASCSGVRCQSERWRNQKKMQMCVKGNYLLVVDMFGG